ncbi:MAG: hypothetical protein JW731_02975 [Bacteroidales bacterium]|nr:hypothetical protein [Bacteroidales bacterium]
MNFFGKDQLTVSLRRSGIRKIKVETLQQTGFELSTGIHTETGSQGAKKQRYRKGKPATVIQNFTRLRKGGTERQNPERAICNNRNLAQCNHYGDCSVNGDLIGQI